MNNQSEEISDNTLLLLKELYRGQNKDIAIQNLLLDLIETKIAYYELLNQQMEEKQPIPVSRVDLSSQPMHGQSSS